VVYPLDMVAVLLSLVLSCDHFGLLAEHGPSISDVLAELD
jgi:hypothetical protein